MKVQIKCDRCGVSFERRRGEVNRSLRLGRPQYCGAICMGRNSALIRNPERYPKAPMPTNGKGKALDDLSPFRGYFNKLKSRKETGVCLQDLKDQWDAQKGICPLTGWQLELPKTNGYKRICHPRRASLDRIDSSRGYMIDNIRWVAAIVNFAKNSWTDEDVIEFAEAVILNLK